jgi:hypothetical protein
LVAGSVTAAKAAGMSPPGDSTVSYNTMRTGWDDQEPDLLPADVTASDFGPLFRTQVTGQVYAQPLVAKQTPDSPGMLVVATEANNIYGLDPATGAQQWTTNLGPPWSSSVLGCGDLAPTLGVTSAPVYDASTNTIYAMSKTSPDGLNAVDPEWFLHALDATTGQERTGWPVQIGGHPDNDPSETFNPETAGQRAGLLLLDGVVYAGFASHCDHPPYNGYVAGVSTTTAKQTALFTTEVGTSTGEAGIWQAGGGLVSDGPGQIIVATGNGGNVLPSSPGETPSGSLEEAVVRLTVQPDGTLKATDWFSPTSRATLDKFDSDLGSGGPMAIPDGYGTASHPHLLVQDGKDGHVYLLDRDLLGGLATGPGGTDAPLGVTGPFNGVWGHPAFWGGGAGSFVYTVENAGFLRALRLTANASGVPSLTSVATSSSTFGYTSGSPVVTSDGDTSSSALVWVVSVAGPAGTSPVLNAYNALPSNGLMQKVYSAPLDPPGVTNPNLAHAVKFTTVATDGGRVFVGTRDGYVFGFGHPSAAPLDASPTDFGNVAVGSTRTLPVTVTAARPVTVTAASGGAGFTVAVAPPTTLPVTLATGDTLTLNVTFKPSAAGEQSQNLLLAAAERGITESVTFDLSGFGTQPGLTASPTSIVFGKVPVGSVNTSGVNVLNNSGGSESFTTKSTLKPPFSSSALPTGTTTIPAGGSLAIPINYAPKAASAGQSASITLTVPGLTPLVIHISGSAVNGSPKLTLIPKTVYFGTVARGHSLTKSFTIRNTGNATLTLEKAAPPSGVFTTTTPVAEGSKILPGAGIVQMITFKPTKKGFVTATYLITGNDGKGQQVVTLRGTGS